ncbi:hypothetical protein FAIPA1_480008 [Frankia sp. AiPs1]
MRESEPTRAARQGSAEMVVVARVGPRPSTRRGSAPHVPHPLRAQTPERPWRAYPSRSLVRENRLDQHERSGQHGSC